MSSVHIQVAALAMDPSQQPVAGDDATDAMWLDIGLVSELEGRVTPERGEGGREGRRLIGSPLVTYIR
jgi:hypothetical protein